MPRLTYLLIALIFVLVSCTKPAIDPVVQPAVVKSLGFTKAWGNAFGGTDAETSTSLVSTSDGGYVTIGRTYSNDGDVTGFRGLIDLWIVKVDAGGNKVWQRTIGGSKDDYGLFIAQNPDGSLVCGGFTKSSDGDISSNQGNTDALLLKLDKNGNLLWLKTFGGTGSDYAASIVRNADGTFLIGGSSSNDSGTSDQNAWTFKVDANGMLIWQKKFGGSGEDQFNSIIPTTDGGYILAGTTGSNDGDISGFHASISDVWVVKIDGSGNKIWTRAIGGSGGESPGGITQSNDDGYILVGRSTSNDGDITGNQGGLDGYIIKLDKNGNTLWQKTLGGTNSDWLQTIIPSSDGGFLIGASSKSNDGDFSSILGFQDAWIVKIDSDGNMMGKQIVGGSAHDEIAALTINTDGSYAFAGSSQSVDGDVSGHHGSILTDFWVLKFTDK